MGWNRGPMILAGRRGIALVSSLSPSCRRRRASSRWKQIESSYTGGRGGMWCSRGLSYAHPGHARSIIDRAAQDIRINQRQADINEIVVGQSSERHIVEWDRISSSRGPGHEARATANDPLVMSIPAALPREMLSSYWFTASV